MSGYWSRRFRQPSAVPDFDEKPLRERETTMLHAAAKRKLRTYALNEDEITSSIFGPLSYLTVEQVWLFFKKLIPVEGLWPNVAPDKQDFFFWENIALSGRVEPDLMIKFSYRGTQVLTLLVEVKWNASLFPKDQLKRQWDSIEDTEKSHCLHIYVVKDILGGKREISESLDLTEDKRSRNRWKDRLLCIGWRDLAEVLQANHPFFPIPLASWAQDTRSFLNQLGISAFTGFDGLPDIDASKIAGQPIFWAESTWFSFLHKGALQESDLKKRPILWNE